ncbi:MAG: hypothetical protein QOH78_927 [Verrucomicrobiota bacterium]
MVVIVVVVVKKRRAENQVSHLKMVRRLHYHHPPTLTLNRWRFFLLSWSTQCVPLCLEGELERRSAGVME